MVTGPATFQPTSNHHDQIAAEAATDVLRRCHPRHFSGDGMFVADRVQHFLDDPHFVEVLDRHASAPIYQAMAWRLHTLVWAVEQALRVDGSVMECGTFRAFKMAFLVDYFAERLHDRGVYVVDTFEGIDPDQRDGSPIEPGEHAKARLHEFVEHRFRDHPHVTVVRGAAPASVHPLPIEQVAFLHLDMNSWQAETGVLEWAWDRLPIGAVVVLDDFGLYTHRAQAQHELPWLAERGHAPLELPTGQAVVVRHG